MAGRLNHVAPGRLYRVHRANSPPAQTLLKIRASRSRGNRRPLSGARRPRRDGQHRPDGERSPASPAKGPPRQVAIVGAICFNQSINYPFASFVSNAATLASSS